MKVKIKNFATSVYTMNSPYPYENGSHQYVSTIAVCGKCGYSLESARFYQDWNFCPKCGEKIDWPEEERRK